MSCQAEQLIFSFVLAGLAAAHPSKLAVALVVLAEIVVAPDVTAVDRHKLGEGWTLRFESEVLARRRLVLFRLEVERIRRRRDL